MHPMLTRNARRFVTTEQERFCEQITYDRALDRRRYEELTTVIPILPAKLKVTQPPATRTKGNMGKECTPVTAASIWRKDQEPPSRSIQPMHTAPAHAQEESHHRCSTGRWIAKHGSAPCAQYSNDTRSRKWGPTGVELHHHHVARVIILRYL